MTEVTAHGCEDCPFRRCRWDEWCYAPYFDVRRRIAHTLSELTRTGYYRPLWCPLPITVKVEP